MYVAIADEQPTYTVMQELMASNENGIAIYNYIIVNLDETSDDGRTP